MMEWRSSARDIIRSRRFDLDWPSAVLWVSTSCLGPTSLTYSTAIVTSSLPGINYLVLVVFDM